MVFNRGGYRRLVLTSAGRPFAFLGTLRTFPLRAACLLSRFALVPLFVVSRSTNHHFIQQWISEVMHFCAGLPIILVGCKKDLRREPRVIEELRKTNQRPVTPEEVRCISAPVLCCTLIYLLL